MCGAGWAAVTLSACLIGWFVCRVAAQLYKNTRDRDVAHKGVLSVPCDMGSCFWAAWQVLTSVVLLGAVLLVASFTAETGFCYCWFAM